MSTQYTRDVILQPVQSVDLSNYRDGVIPFIVSLQGWISDDKDSISRIVLKLIVYVDPSTKHNIWFVISYELCCYVQLILINYEHHWRHIPNGMFFYPWTQHLSLERNILFVPNSKSARALTTTLPSQIICSPEDGYWRQDTNRKDVNQSMLFAF